MSTKKYKKPNITINKVYTKNGDTGSTSLVGGDSISKDSLRISAFGEVDELNSFLGNCIVLINELNKPKFETLVSKLTIIQHELFNLGNMLATKSYKYLKSMPQIDEKSIKSLEEMIDFYNKDLPTLKSFVLPCGSELSVRFHLTRTVCRRCERNLVTIAKKFDNFNMELIEYLNRLSDYLFVVSRWIS